MKYDACPEYGDLDTPALGTDGRADWDDFVHHRSLALDPDGVEALKRLWRLPDARPSEGQDRS